MRRTWVLAAALPAIAFVLLPEGRLGCDDPMEHETSPDAAWTLTLCRRPMLFAMPGGGSDAPGWIVLRDAQGAIRGVTDLGMVQLYRGATDMPPQWMPGRVVIQLVADMPLSPASGPVMRWLASRTWRWRALLGLVPSDDDMH